LVKKEPKTKHHELYRCIQGLQIPSRTFRGQSTVAMFLDTVEDLIARHTQ